MSEQDPFEDIDADLNHFDQLFPSFRASTENQYFHSTRFNSNFNGNNPSDLAIFHVNIRSLNRNGDALIAYLSTLHLKFNIICLTETWMNENSIDNFFPNYNSYMSTRQNRVGGGVAIYVNKQLKSSLIHELTSNTEHIESVFINISCSDKKILIGTIYRPPNSNTDNFCNFFSANLMPQITNNTNITICGDFNLDLLNLHDSAPSSSFYNLVNTMSLLPTIRKPTRITDSSCTLIDNIITNYFEDFVAGIMTIDLTDHLPTFIVFKNYFVNPRQTPKQITYRLENETTLDSFFYSLQSSNWNDINTDNDLESCVVKLHDKILEHYNNCCPIKTKLISYKDVKKPYITSALKTEMKTRENNLNLYRRGLMTWNEYTRLRNRTTHLIRIARTTYYHNLFENLKTDVKKTWTEINKILSNKKSNKKTDIKCVIYNGTDYSLDKDIANALNEHFSTIGLRLDNNNPLNYSHRQYVRVNMPNSFFFSPVTAQTVETIIHSLKNKSANTITYSNKAFKHIATIISPIIARLINQSLSTGIFPDCLKTARVVPIFKAGDPKDVNNYRPISILSIISKIFERVVHNQLMSFLIRFNLITPCQFGFLKRLSTSHATIETLQYIYDNLDCNNTILSFFLDFSKAFDCVHHAILLDKMNMYGIRGVAGDWFKSYLSNRTQFVSVNGVQSDTGRIERGVPQGSILGPLLFLIFINDLPNCSDNFKFTLFADDSTPTCKFDNHVSHQQITNDLTLNMQHVHSWLNANHIKINTSKSFFIAFSYRGNVEFDPIPFGNSFIHQATNVKFLGLQIDNHLSFSHHIDNICSKISKSVGILYKLNHTLPINTLITLHNTLILPYLTYCIESWHGTSRYLTDKVEILHKKAIRAIFNLPYNSHTNDYFKNNNILKLQDLYKLKLCLLLYQYINPSVPLSLTHRIRTHDSIHNHNTRHRRDLNLPRYTKASTQSCFLFQSISEWNTLPQTIKNSTSKNTLKKNLKSYYLSKY